MVCVRDKNTAGGCLGAAGAVAVPNCIIVFL